MKDQKNNTTHQVCLILGSNINPNQNIPLAIQLLKKYFVLVANSNAWETPAYGAAGSNFINAAVLISTYYTPAGLKCSLLRKIETLLGRKRVVNKYAPRTIDIDVVIFDNFIIDNHIWTRPYITVPCAELLPDITQEVSGKRLELFARNVLYHYPLHKRPEIVKKVFYSTD